MLLVWWKNILTMDFPLTLQAPPWILSEWFICFLDTYPPKKKQGLGWLGIVVHTFIMDNCWYSSDANNSTAFQEHILEFLVNDGYCSKERKIYLLYEKIVSCQVFSFNTSVSRGDWKWKSSKGKMKSLKMGNGQDVAAFIELEEGLIHVTNIFITCILFMVVGLDVLFFN